MALPLCSAKFARLLNLPRRHTQFNSVVELEQIVALVLAERSPQMRGHRQTELEPRVQVINGALNQRQKVREPQADPRKVGRAMYPAKRVQQRLDSFLEVPEHGILLRAEHERVDRDTYGV